MLERRNGDGSGISTARPSLRTIGPPNLVIASPNGTTQPTRNKSPPEPAVGATPGSAANSEESGSDTYSNGLQRRRVASSYRPPLLTPSTRSLSEILANSSDQAVSPSPTNSLAPYSLAEAKTGPHMYALENGSEPLVPDQQTSSIRKHARVHTEGSAGAYSLEPSLSEGPINGDLVEEDSELDEASDTSDDAIGMEQQASEDEDDDDDDDAGADDFEFSLPGRDGSNSFENTLLDTSPGVQGPYEGANLISPTDSTGERSTILPSISENAEHGDLLDTSNAADVERKAEQTDADAALHAAQTARRRARRRVNVSGRLPFNLGNSLVLESHGTNGTSPSPSSSPPFGQVASGLRPRSPSSSNTPQGVGARLKPAKLRLRPRAQTDPPPAPSRTSPLASPLGKSDKPQKGDASSHPPVGISTPANRLLDVSSASAPDLAAVAAESVPIARSVPDTALAEVKETDLEPGKPTIVRSKSAGPGSRAAAQLSLQDLSPLPTLHTSAAPAVSSANGSLSVPLKPLTRSSSVISPSPAESSSKGYDPYISFPISRTVANLPQPPKQSALSIMRRSDDAGGAAASSENPFNEYYGALFAPTPVSAGPAGRIARRGGAGTPNGNNHDITVYYPFSKEKSKPLRMGLKPDLKVEEVIGCALWKYWAEDRRPSLCPNEQGENDLKWESRDMDTRAKLGVSAWVLRIADEDEDGEIDDDFPAPDRTRAAKGFGHCYAVVEASVAQGERLA